jgi:hypothetical protein
MMRSRQDLAKAIVSIGFGLLNFVRLSNAGALK